MVHIFLDFDEVFCHLIGIYDVLGKKVDVYGRPCQEEYNTDHHQNKVGSSSPRQLSLLGLTSSSSSFCNGLSRSH